MRHFIHHPKNVPIDVSIACRDAGALMAGSSLVRTGGLAFLCEKELSPATLVQIKVPYPCIKSDFVVEGTVAWCRKVAHGWALGIEFMNEDDAFHVRMFEQMCHIENYRLEMSRKEGRSLNARDAAIEWVTKYSADFPNPGMEPVH